MNIKGIDGVSYEDLNREIERGGKFVIYQYCISVLIMTFKNPSSIHFVKAGESRFLKGLIFTFISLLFGWWGIPWGPIYTIGVIASNCGGGKDVTYDVVSSLMQAEKEASEGAAV